LERTLEKERDDNKKEKANRKRNEKLQLNILQRVQQVHTYVVFQYRFSLALEHIMYKYVFYFFYAFSDNRIDFK
jgi:hypothetical protein